MSDTNGHSGSFIVRLTKLLQEHEEKANAIRLTLSLLSNDPVAVKTPRPATVMAAAIALDTARATKTHRSTPPKRNPKTYGKKIQAQRAATLAMLDTFSTNKPTTLAEIRAKGFDDARLVGLGSMVRYGYLHRTKSGDYLRTMKPFRVGDA